MKSFFYGSGCSFINISTKPARRRHAAVQMAGLPRTDVISAPAVAPMAKIRITK